MSQPRAENDMRLRRSSRDTSTLIPRLTAWLATQLPEDADPSVALRAGIDSNGMSAETLVLSATWTEAGAPQVTDLIARMVPAPGDFPILADYNLPDQFDAMRIVAESSSVPSHGLGSSSRPARCSARPSS